MARHHHAPLRGDGAPAALCHRLARLGPATRPGQSDDD